MGLSACSVFVCLPACIVFVCVTHGMPSSRVASRPQKPSGLFWDGEPRTTTSTFTRPLRYAVSVFVCVCVCAPACGVCVCNGSLPANLPPGSMIGGGGGGGRW